MDASGVRPTSNTSVLTFNSDSNQMRFRYYKSTSYANMKAVQFYKQLADTPVTASSLAEYIMEEDTENQCITKFPIAKARYLRMSADEKALFVKTSEDTTIKNAVERYEAWAEALGQSPYETGGLQNTSLVVGTAELTVALVIIAIVGVSAIISISLIKKNRKKEQ